MDIRQFFSNLRIRAKLLLAFGSVLLLSLVLAALSFRTIDRVSQYKGLNERTDALLIHLQSLEIAMDEFIYEEFKSKEFLEGGQPRSLASFAANYSDALEKIKEIQRIPWLTQAESVKQVDVIQSEMKELQLSFSNLTTKLRERGFKDFGLEGTLRKAIHQVEKADFKYDKAELLTLRRHEKDFFLRKDVKYEAEFNKTITEFRLKATKTAQPEVLKLIDDYQKGFNDIVETETVIGLAEDKGLRGEVRGGILAIRPLIADFSMKMDEESSTMSNQAITFLTVIVVLQFLFGLVLAIFYASQLSRPVKEIRTAVQLLAAGKYPKKMLVDSTEEMGQTKEGFNQFIDRLQTATTFAESMGKGNLQVQYDENFSEDVLAKSLVTMQQKLREAEGQKSKTNWVNEGGAKFNDILKKEDVALEVLGDDVLRFLITYIGANQGALYIKDGEEMLTRISTYAYGKKKFVDQQISVGSGLVGQCVLEAHTIYIKEVPPDYVFITSGLGQATPRAVLIVPLKVRDAVMGVLEMASFNSFETFQILFIEKISENIATLLSNRKSSELTKRLLQESQERSEMLTQQEEEMRQNTEELQATQEEMIRQRSELEKEIAILRQRLAGKIVLEQ